MRSMRTSTLSNARIDSFISMRTIGVLLTVIFCLIAFQQSASAEAKFIENMRAQIPAAEIIQHEAEPPYQQMLEIRLPQPLDHDNPNAGFFIQYIYLWHIDVFQPTIIETHGYWVNTAWDKELSRLLNANHISVEHRYFGNSVPDKMDWQYLNIYQVVRDYHRIAMILKPIYQEKWVSTGISKGGQTALTYRRYFPDDVDVTVAYVAPMNLNREDHRMDRHLEKVGTDECRDHHRDFQRMVLERRAAMIPLLEEYSQTSGLTFFDVGLDAALEYSALEYTFSFWQWGDGDCSVIPGRDATDQEIFDHLLSVSGFYLYSDQGIDTYEPMFYQNMREWGYYGFITYHMRDLLEARPYPDNAEFAPVGADITYQRHVLQDILNWIDHKGNNIIYINGANDPWSGSAVKLSGKTNALRFDVKGGNHGSRIADLSRRQKRIAYRHLEQWLDIRLPIKKWLKKKKPIREREDRESTNPEARRGFYKSFFNRVD